MRILVGEDEQAARWYRRGAEAGYVGAQVQYAGLLLQGRGAAKDEEAAARWYAAAAAQGDRYSYLALAELHTSGTGVARDPVEAHALAVVAAAVLQRSDLLDERLAQLKEGLEKQLSPDQTKAANLRARTIRPDLDHLRSAKALEDPLTVLLGLAGLGLGTIVATIVVMVVYRRARRAFRQD